MPAPRLDRRDVGVALALAAATLWGVSGAVAADAFAAVPPARVAQFRALVAAALLIPLAWRRGRLDPEGRLWLLAAIGLNLAVVNVTFYWAIDRLGVGPGATVQFLGPVLVLAWISMVQRRPVGAWAWAAAVVAVAGVGLVTRAWDTQALDLAGVAAGLAAAVTFASYLLIGERLGRDLAALTIMAHGFAFASLFWLVLQPLWGFPTGLEGPVWAKLAWVGIAGTAVPFLAEAGALRRASSGTVGVVATAEPVIGAAAAWVLLGQSLAPVQVVGGLLVVAAVASIQRRGLSDVEVPLDVGR